MLRDRLEALGYLPIERLPALGRCVSGYHAPEGFSFMAKLTEAEVEYEMADGSSFSNRIALGIFFLIGPDGRLADCFCAPPDRFILKAQADFDAFARLHQAYRDDLREAVESDKASEGSMA